MDVNDLIKGLQTHLDFFSDCDECPFNGETVCFSKLVNEITKALEEKKKLSSKCENCDLYFKAMTKQEENKNED